MSELQPMTATEIGRRYAVMAERYSRATTKLWEPVLDRLCEILLHELQEKSGHDHTR